MHTTPKPSRFARQGFQACAIRVPTPSRKWSSDHSTFRNWSQANTFAKICTLAKISSRHLLWLFGMNRPGRPLPKRQAPPKDYASTAQHQLPVVM
jgi:hypothetical protein